MLYQLSYGNKHARLSRFLSPCISYRNREAGGCTWGSWCPASRARRGLRGERSGMHYRIFQEVSRLQRRRAISTYSGFCSNSKARRLSLLATMPTVPEPAKGSRTSAGTDWALQEQEGCQPTVWTL